MSIETNAAIDGAEAHSRATDSHRLRNISELRLLFAASVVLSHAAALTGPDSYYTLRVILNSEAAVQGFFILSGYLVCGSFDRIRNAREFYRRRLLRIYPAYFVAVIVFAFLGILQALMLGSKVSWTDLPPYLLANLATLNFIQPDIGGVFSNNNFQAINGALWSIKVELMFYFILPLLYLIGQRTTFRTVSIAMITIGAIWWPLLQHVSSQLGMEAPLSFKFQLPGQLHYFGIGIALFAHSRKLISNAALLATVGWAIVLLWSLGQASEALHAAALVLLIGGISLLPEAKNFFNKQDVSYGIYLCHFPVVQILLAFGLGNIPFLLYLLVVIFLTVSYGLLSWNLIERPALSWKIFR